MKLDLTGVKGVIASVLIVLSLVIGVLNAVQGALPPTVETLGASNFDTLQVGDGSASEPAFGFTADTDTGVYRIGANNVGIAVGGSKIVDVNAGGLQVDTITATTIGGAVNITGTLSQSGLAFAGPLTYSLATAYVSGTAIATGWSTTATACIVSPATQMLTTTVHISSTTAFSVETSLDGGAFYWICGK